MDHHFLAELKEGAIHLHDDLQFELKLEFNYNSKLKNNNFIQEFYLFIPESLHIDANNYSQKDFYLDQTNFIRYKTPHFTFTELLNPDNMNSPLNVIMLMEIDKDDQKELEDLINKIKLFGNIFRSTLRNETLHLINKIESSHTTKENHHVKSLITKFCENVTQTHSSFLKIKAQLKKKFSNHTLNENLKFVDEFITNTIEYYLIGFLEELRSVEWLEQTSCDQKICKILIDEKNHRAEKLLPKIKNKTVQEVDEMIAYRQGLLQKFMVETLLLKSSRIDVSEQHGPLFGSIAAGSAMLIYMILFLFTWQSTTFIINSIPFVLSVVIFYILKDRIKEGVKSYYKKKVNIWFPDFKTKIYSPQDFPIGELKENFSFIEKENLPEEIYKARNKEFHNHLEALHRHETIIYYKREVTLFEHPENALALNELNMIFRYNIHRYLQKASDPIQYRAMLREDNFDLIEQKLPKVYHLNIVMKETHAANNHKIESKIKKYRIILDKTGIQQVENL